MMKRKQEKQQDLNIPKSPFRFLLYVSRPYFWYAFFAVLVVVVASTANAFSFLFLKEIIDNAEAGLQKEVIFLGLLYPASMFILHLLWRVSAYIALFWVRGIRKDSYNLLAQYTYGHSSSYFSDRFAGSLLSKINNIVGSGERLTLDFLWSHTETFVLFIASFVVILTIDVQTAFVFSALILSLVLINYKMVNGKRSLSKASAASDTLVRARLVDVISNISATRQYVRTDYELQEFGEMTTTNTKIYSKSWMYSDYMRIVNSFVLFSFVMVMFWLLSQRWAEGVISTGEFIAVVTLTFNLSGTVIFISRIFHDTAKAYGEMEEGLEDIMLVHEITDAPKAKKLIVKKGEVVWDEVTFEYGENKVFDNFNLTIKAGERVGLVGSSGAGKTTFVSLLLRQHDIGGGAITIDGQDISKVTQDSLRENIAVVPQEPMLFHRSIRENIAYGKPDATDEEIIAVAKKAQAHDFIDSLPQKYETMVGERGVKLSGGQKQRVAIARAMLKNAPILVLDEATSALDSESEVAIQKALHVLMEGKTVVAIAHRLSTLREMDRILVLENGKVVEDGTHTKLAKAGGVYQRLWEHQAGGFLQD